VVEEWNIKVETPSNGTPTAAERNKQNTTTSDE
jgi:hypothetical protein